MVNINSSVSAKNSLNSSTSNENLNHLDTLTRTKESTIGAVSNIARGSLRLLFSKGQRIKGAAQAGQGVLDILDIVPSFAADTIHFITGPKTGKTGISPYRYNISRALGSATEVRDPLGAVGAAVDIVHAIGFKAGSDVLRVLQHNKSILSNAA